MAVIVFFNQSPPHCNGHHARAMVILEAIKRRQPACEAHLITTAQDIQKTHLNGDGRITFHKIASIMHKKRLDRLNGLEIAEYSDNLHRKRLEQMLDILKGLGNDIVFVVET